MKIGDYFRRLQIELRERLLFFAGNVNGLKHVVTSRNTPVKWLWVAVLATLAGCLGALLASASAGAALSYTPDLRYLPWTTTFPAVTVCQIFYVGTVEKIFTQSQYGSFTTNLSYNYRRYLTNLLYGLGSCTKELCVPCGSTVPCNVPWRQIIEHVHESCEEILDACEFNGAAFPCCARFRAVDSELGLCYSFNTLQHVNSTQEQLMTVNSTTGPGLLTFRLRYDAQISVHSPEELSTNNLDNKFKFDVKIQEANWVEFLFSLVEIANDPLLKFEELFLRGCRYHEEVPPTPLHTYPVYSYGACRLAQSTEESFHECSCVHPVRDPVCVFIGTPAIVLNRRSYCNYTGLNCLVTYTAKHKYGIDHKKVHEPCLPSCSESELTTIHITRKWVAQDREAGTRVNIRMSALPHLRYERHLLRSNLDLVVSIGGVIGLFFGASILSMVEALYLILRNPH